MKSYNFGVRHNGEDLQVEALLGASASRVTVLDEDGRVLSLHQVSGELLEADERLEFIFEAGFRAGLSVR
jgi:hypothetical protein